MTNYSKRTALFIRYLADEMPMSKIREVVDRASHDAGWNAEELDMSGNEKALASALGHNADELNAELERQERSQREAIAQLNADLQKTRECWQRDRVPAYELHQAKETIAELMTRLGLGPTEPAA